MKGVTAAMGQINRQMNLPSLQKIMQEFQRENEKMEIVSEVTEDAIDDAFEEDEEEEETDELVSQVLDEIGIEINQEVNYPVFFFYTPRSQPNLLHLILNETSELKPINLYVQLLNAPSTAVSAPAAKHKVAQAEPPGNHDSGIDSDLEARLDNLRRM